MNEALRQFALGVAGVRLWYARSPLPGAAPSPDYDFGEAEQSEPEGTEPVPGLKSADLTSSPPGSDASRQGLARLQGLLAEGGQPRRPMRAVKEVTVEPPDPEPGPSEASDSDAGTAGEGAQVPEVRSAYEGLAGKSVALHWRFWHGSRWLLMSSSPDEAGRGLEDRLAENILKALGDVVERTDSLRWPVFSNPAVPGNDAAGAADVLAALAQDVEAPRQLWLGIDPEDPDFEQAELWRSLLAPMGRATVSFPRSLAALSSEPDSKRRLWRALRRVEAG
ncbi:hypothetical protein [Marinobacter sp.]|uniref:hypothetical protein n=1 Tax=Marinobacter sp. TaxID=50741 RepID=UPI0035670D8F